MWKCVVYFPPLCVCVCVCARVLCKSIFVCFATSLDIPFGATDRKAVKCDLNILCLHLFPPFSPPSLFLSLSRFPLISFSSPSITISSGANMFLCFDGLSTPPPPSTPLHHQQHPKQKCMIISSYLQRCVCSQHKVVSSPRVSYSCKSQDMFYSYMMYRSCRMFHLQVLCVRPKYTLSHCPPRTTHVPVINTPSLPRHLHPHL